MIEILAGRWFKRDGDGDNTCNAGGSWGCGGKERSHCHLFLLLSCQYLEYETEMNSFSPPEWIHTSADLVQGARCKMHIRYTSRYSIIKQLEHYLCSSTEIWDSGCRYWKQRRQINWLSYNLQSYLHTSTGTFEHIQYIIWYIVKVLLYVRGAIMTLFYKYKNA